MKGEQAAWWEHFWEEQAEICQKIDAKQVYHLHDPWLRAPTRPEAESQHGTQNEGNDQVSNANGNMSEGEEVEPEMYVGLYKNPQRQREEASKVRGHVNEIKVGDMIAVEVSKEAPFWLAKVLEIKEGDDCRTLTIHWYTMEEQDAEEVRENCKSVFDAKYVKDYVRDKNWSEDDTAERPRKKSRRKKTKPSRPWVQDLEVGDGKTTVLA